MTLDRGWIPTSELREMRYLGWYSEPGGKRHRAPWITDDGDLDPDALVNSELFRGDDVEAAIDFLSIPSDVCARSDGVVLSRSLIELQSLRHTADLAQYEIYERLPKIIRKQQRYREVF